MRDCKDLIQNLTQFKKSIKTIVPIKEQEVQYYKNFIDFLIKYEEVTTKKGTEQDVVSLLSGNSSFDMKGKLSKMVRLYIINDL